MTIRNPDAPDPGPFAKLIHREPALDYPWEVAAISDRGAVIIVDGGIETLTLPPAMAIELAAEIIAVALPLITGREPASGSGVASEDAAARFASHPNPFIRPVE